MSVNNSLSSLASALAGLSGSGNSSTSVSNPPVNFSGLGSGIDTTTIIQELLSIDKIPISRLKNQQNGLNTEFTALQQLASGLQAFASAAARLNSFAAFNPINALSSDTSVATITGSSTATAGTYNLTVTKLAQAEKISSAAQNDATTALNLSGTIVINGKGVQVKATDSLTSIAQKINGASAGVSAGIINGGTGSAYLTITSSQTGAANKIQIADLQGTISSTLGLISGSDAIRKPITGGAASYTFNSQSTALATQLNANSIGQQSFAINGINVTFNPNTGSLQDLMSAINSANTGANASIQTSTDPNGKTLYQLNITGMNSFSDTSGFLKGIGVLQQGYGHEVLAGQDAAFSLDNINLTSATNTVNDIIQGATITLLKGTPASPASTTITLSQDTSTVEKNVQGLVDSYNAIQKYISDNSQLDTKTYATGPLFGNATVQQIQQQLSSSLFANAGGLQPPYNNLAGVGFSFNTDGTLKLDSAKLESALKSNPDGVSQLFRATGQGSTNSIGFVSNTSKSVSTGSGNYAINITQVASEGSFTSSSAQTQPLSANELLTFNGALFGSSAYTLLLPSGASQSAVVDQINSDAKLKGLVNASIDSNGKLLITSKKYGSNGNFTVTSDTAASASSSGIAGGTYSAGVDVAGTINGEAATGNGQYLTGKSGNAKTDGLQIVYSGTTTGQVGSLIFNKGVGAMLSDLSNSFTDPVNGLITTVNNTIQSQITDMDSQIQRIQGQVAARQAQLQAQFNAMEQAISALKSQGSRLSSIVSAGSKSGN